MNIEKWKIADLAPNRRQHDFFPEATASELSEFAADIDRTGMRNPPHVDPSGRILMGHRRVRAAESLGWTELEVVVRYDLDGDEDRATYELIADNLFRQQLDPISIARCYEELRVLERRLGKEKGRQGLGELRDAIAARLPVRLSGRQLDRLRRLLKLPAGIQDAIREGKLRATHGEIILGRPRKAQEEIAAALVAGEEPGRVIKRFGLTSTPAKKSPAAAAAMILKSLNKELPVLRAHLDEMDDVHVGGEQQTLDLLRDASEFFAELRERRQARETDSAALSSQFPKVGHRSPDELSD